MQQNTSMRLRSGAYEGGSSQIPIEIAECEIGNGPNYTNLHTDVDEFGDFMGVDNPTGEHSARARKIIANCKRDRASKHTHTHTHTSVTTLNQIPLN